MKIDDNETKEFNCKKFTHIMQQKYFKKNKYTYIEGRFDKCRLYDLRIFRKVFFAAF